MTEFGSQLKKIGLGAIVTKVRAVETAAKALAVGATGAAEVANGADALARKMDDWSRFVVAESTTATDGVTLRGLADSCRNSARIARSKVTL